MDLLEETSSSGGGGGDGGDCRRRRMCISGYGRPVNVCLCHALPSALVPIATHVIILYHPHERRHKLVTFPFLSKSLQNCKIIVGRKLKYGQSELLYSLHDQANENPNLPLGRAVYLFPGPDALPFDEVSQMYSSLDDADREGLVLIVFDGTWKHAKEMVAASLPFLSKFV